jgi:type IV secretory pathway TrbF-like protein
MSTPFTVPPNGREYGPPPRAYVEFFGAHVVTNRYLRIAVLCLTVVTLGLIGLHVHTWQTLRSWKPTIIRIDSVGRAAPMTAEELTYRPQDAELRYFLSQFTRKHFGRLRATVKQDYTESLYFLDGRLAALQTGPRGASQVIAAFLAERGDEVDIDIKNVAFVDLRQPPYRATVDFERVYKSASDGTELRRDLYVGNFTFVLKDGVPNQMIPVNPLGLTITYFREDQAFR